MQDPHSAQCHRDSNIPPEQAAHRFPLWWRVLRRILYLVELPIAIAVCFGPSLLSYHGTGSSLFTVAVAITLLLIGAYLTLKSTLIPLSPNAVLLGAAGLVTHSFMSLTVIDNGFMLYPDNWMTYDLSSFLCFQGPFLAVAAVDGFLFVRYTSTSCSTVSATNRIDSKFKRNDIAGV